MLIAHVVAVIAASVARLTQMPLAPPACRLAVLYTHIHQQGPRLLRVVQLAALLHRQHLGLARAAARTLAAAVHLAGRLLPGAPLSVVWHILRVGVQGCLVGRALPCPCRTPPLSPWHDRCCMQWPRPAQRCGLPGCCIVVRLGVLPRRRMVGDPVRGVVSAWGVLLHGAQRRLRRQASRQDGPACDPRHPILLPGPSQARQYTYARSSAPVQPRSHQ